jgi:hypothetical protein
LPEREVAMKRAVFVLFLVIGPAHAGETRDIPVK